MSAQLISQPPLEARAEAPVEETPAVAATRLGKVFEVRPVLRDVSFSIPTGASVALFGPNGAGKTTLLRALATLVKPSTGHAEIAGLDVVRDAPDVRRVIGYVGHQPHLYDELTARENLLFFARMYGLRDGAERSARLLEWVGLAAKSGERVRTLSRGQAQRLSLARGVINDPTVLLLDEPDTGLDDDASALLTQLIHDRAAQRLTTIFTTHHLERGLDLSDIALILAGGRVVTSAPSRDLSAQAIHDWYHHVGRRSR